MNENDEDRLPRTTRRSTTCRSDCIREMTPIHFYGFWPELERIEVGDRAACSYDESNSIMHRFVKAVGIEYDLSHNFWRRNR